MRGPQASTSGTAPAPSEGDDAGDDVPRGSWNWKRCSRPIAVGSPSSRNPNSKPPGLRSRRARPPRRLKNSGLRCQAVLMRAASAATRARPCSSTAGGAPIPTEVAIEPVAGAGTISVLSTRMLERVAADRQIVGNEAHAPAVGRTQSNASLAATHSPRRSRLPRSRRGTVRESSRAARVRAP